jgi:hypothetical protein
LELIVMDAIATLSKPLQLAKHGMDLWRKRRLSGALVEAQTALGERMYAAGIDDGELGPMIYALDERLLWTKAVRGSTHALKATRRQLVLQLAAAALEDDGPLPGADAEYRRAREAQAALENYENSTKGEWR